MGIFGSSARVPDPYARQIDKKRVILIVALIGGVLLAIVFILMSFAGNSKQDVMRVAARQNDLLRIMEKTKKSIRSAELSRVNSDATLLLTSNSTNLANLLRTLYGAKTIDGNITKEVTDSSAITDLTNAALLNKFDASYRDLIRNKLANIISLAQDIKAKDNNKKLQDALKKVISDSETIDKRLSALNL